MNPKEAIIQAAQAEIDQEDFRKLVELEKARLRKYRPWWVRFFPWRIRIVRIDKW